MNLILPSFIGSAISASAWTILVLVVDRRKRRLVELVGPWTTSLVLAAYWQADAIPWFWGFTQGVLTIWLGALILLGMAAISFWQGKQPGYQALLCCAALGIIANLSAGMQILWSATVSPGGI